MALGSAGRTHTEAARVGEVDLFSIAASGGELRDVSEAFACLLGVTRGVLVGRPLSEIVHADDLDEVRRRLAESQRGTGEARLECRFMQSDGRAVNLQWVEIGRAHV